MLICIPVSTTADRPTDCATPLKLPRISPTLCNRSTFRICKAQAIMESEKINNDFTTEKYDGGENGTDDIVDLNMNKDAR